jgi:hypothetical protein
MEEMQPRLTIQDLFGYAIAYAIWVVVAAISMFAVLQLRNALQAMWPVISRNRWLLRPIDRFGLVFLGLVWLVYVIFVEQYYRSSITTVRMRRYRARAGSPRASDSAPQNKVLRALRRVGLDILAQRMLPTLGAPVAAVIIAYGLFYLAFWLLPLVR